MNELDQFVKHELRVKHYARYTDDFVIVSKDREYLQSLIPKIAGFLSVRLNLSLHPNKVSIRKYRQGIDFLGYVMLPGHALLRTKTRRRILKKVRKISLPSYLGVLSHANAHELGEELRNLVFFQENL